jgi:hypothetical protein
VAFDFPGCVVGSRRFAMEEEEIIVTLPNQTRQPTPGARLEACWTSPARRGCAHL